MNIQVNPILYTVTSNVKHDGWRVLPFVNFSIPISAIDSIFKFARSGAATFCTFSAISDFYVDQCCFLCQSVIFNSWILSIETMMIWKECGH